MGLAISSYLPSCLTQDIHLGQQQSLRVDTFRAMHQPPERLKPSIVPFENDLHVPQHSPVGFTLPIPITHTPSDNGASTLPMNRLMKYC